METPEGRDYAKEFIAVGAGFAGNGGVGCRRFYRL
jgi:hypothetical protein